MQRTVELSYGTLSVMDADGIPMIKIGDTTGSSNLTQASVDEASDLESCNLPFGWDDLSGNERWISHLNDELRNLWPQFTQEQKMAIAQSIEEISDDLFNLVIESSE
ncbi:hypothetical protein EYY98_10575 [Obesumbacterium proteus]|nr:hypothetical protein EYY98_10575 [Obesumbacterium proteus]